MAYLADGHNGFIGTVGRLTYYKRRDSDKIYVRRKGGVTKKRFKTDPQFQRSRENNKEFAVRSHAAGWIRHILSPLTPVFNRNVIALLNKPLRLVQTMDAVNGRGDRIIDLQKGGYLLGGLNLNSRHSFESLFTGNINTIIDREKNKLELTIPERIPGLNFFPLSFPFYQFRLATGIIPNLLKGPRDLAGDIYPDKWSKAISSVWISCREKNTEPLKLSIDLPGIPDDCSILHGLAICFSNSPENSEAVKYMGAGRIEAISHKP